MSTDLIFEPTEEELEQQESVQAAFSRIGVRHVSASSIGMYQRCQRQWAYRYVLGIKVPPDAGLLTGLGVHRAAEVGMLHKRDTGENPEPEMAATTAAEYVGEQLATGEVILNDDDHAGAITDKATRVSSAWAEHAAPQVMPVEVEEQFDLEVAGVAVTGRMDVITAERVVDWKTAGKSPNADEHIQSVQTELYALATSKPLTYTFLVDLKSGVKVTDVEIDEAQAAHAARFATDTVAEVARGMALGIWPRNRKGWHCSARWCGYYERCMSGRDDATLSEKAADARAAAGVMW
jgi:CRISPR/Cas system-associated exonuclease Cas4 (RecB family)